MSDLENTNEEEVLKEMHERFSFAVDAWKTQRNLCLDDLRFCNPDNQWPEDVRNERLSQGKPVYVSDRLNAHVKQLTNAQRENRPAVTVHPLNDQADKDTAEVFQGLIRHIEYASGADMAYDTAFEACVRMGIGYFRLITGYSDDISFEQDIKIEAIPNPFSVYIDPTYRVPDGSDIEWAFITEDMTEDEFKETYPDAKLTNYSQTRWIASGDEHPGWISRGTKSVRVVEYFVKEEVPKTIVKLEDGSVHDKKLLDKKLHSKIIAERTSTETKIKWYKANGVEILEQSEWPGRYIPIVPVFGDQINSNGSNIYNGIIRNSKDEQQMMNVAKTTMIETIAMAPKAPWIVPEGSVDAFKEEWKNANRSSYPYLKFKTIDDQGNPLPAPTRNTFEAPIQAVVQAVSMFENDIKATNAMYDPSLGNKTSNDQSGMAIKALQTQGSIGNYHYSDNLSRAIRLEGLMLLDLIPKIYDTKRVVRIVGLDDVQKLVTLNGDGDPSETGCMDKDGVARIFKTDTGKYDVTVSSGPSYQTKRQENLNMLFLLAGKDPQMFATYADLIFGQLDSPVATQLAERARKTLPPALQPVDPNKGPNLQTLQQQNAQMHDLIQQQTQELNLLTDAHQKELMILNAKREIAMLDNQTQLTIQSMKNQDANAQLAFQEELKLIHKKLDQSFQQDQTLLQNQAQQPQTASPEAPVAPGQAPGLPPENPEQPSPAL